MTERLYQCPACWAYEALDVPPSAEAYNVCDCGELMTSVDLRAERYGQPLSDTEPLMHVEGKPLS